MTEARLIRRTLVAYLDWLDDHEATGDDDRRMEAYANTLLRRTTVGDRYPEPNAEEIAHDEQIARSAQSIWKERRQQSKPE